MSSLDKLKELSDRLPLGVRSFALDPSYWDPTSEMCPHDGWVEKVVISELPGFPFESDPVERQDRTVGIEVHLVAGSHARILVFQYKEVCKYSISMSALSKFGNRAHGDWLEDDIDLTDSGRVLHRVLFSGGGEWLIECGDVTLSCAPSEGEQGKKKD